MSNTDNNLFSVWLVTDEKELSKIVKDLAGKYNSPIFISHLTLLGGVMTSFDDLKSGVGAGVRIKTPLGPVKLDYGYPLDSSAPGEKKKPRFHFSMSRGF